MANKGLKEENTMLSFSISDVNISIDLSKVNKNIISYIPLTFNIGTYPINVGIIYNNQNKNNQTMFGKGFKLSLEKNIEEISGDYKVTNSDGSIDDYLYDSTTLEGTLYKDLYDNTLLVKTGIDYYKYEIKDKYNNVMSYEKNSDKLTFVNVLGQYKYLLTNYTDYIKIHNYHNEDLYLYNTNTLVNSFTYNENNNIRYTGSITYSNNKITNISVTKNNTIVKNLTISYNNGICFKNEITKEIVEISESNDVITVNEGYYQNNTNYFNRTTIINYENNNKTKVTNVDLVNSNNNIITTYYFDKFNLLEQIVDNEYNVSIYSFNNEIKKLKYKTGLSHQRIDNLSNVVELTQDNFDYISSSLLFSPVTISQPDNNYLAYMYQNNNNNGSIYFYNNLNGIALDSYGLSLWIKKVSGSGTLKVELTIGNRKDSVLFDETDIPSNYYKMIYLGISSYNSFDKIEMELIITGSLILEFGRLEIFKNNIKIKYEYEESNLVSVESNTNTTHNTYSNNNLINGSYADNQSTTYYEYNDCNQITKKHMPYGIKEEYEYNNDNTLLIKKEFKDNEESKWEENYNYSNNNDLSSYIDIYSKTTYLAYLNHNLSYTIDANYNVISYQYDNFDEIINVYQSVGNELGITYNSTDRTVSNVNTPLGKNYSYSYDNLKRLTSISYNSQTVESYVYNSNNLITSKARFNNTYGYSYDNLKRINSISLNNVLKYQFVYDGKSRLINVKDGNNNYIRKYIYDELDNLIKIEYPNEYNTNDFELDYIYHQNKLAYKQYNKNNNKVYLEEIKINNSLSKNPLNLENYIKNTINLLGTTFNIDYDLRGNGIKILGNVLDDGATDNPIVFKNTIKTLRLDYNKKHLLYCPSLYQTSNDQALGILLWFNISNNNSKSCLFEIKRNDNVLTQRVYCYIENGRIKIDIFNVNGVIKYSILVSDEVITLNLWHYVGFSYEYNSTTLEAIYHLNVDGKYYELKKTDINYHLGQIQNPIYTVGYELSSAGVELMIPGYITALAMSNGRVITEDDMDIYYKLSNEYIMKLDEIDETLNFNSVIEYKKNLLTDFDIIPLHSNVISLKGIRPIKYSYYKANSFVLDDFNYDNKLKTLSYTPLNELVYDYNFINSGGVYLEFNYQKTKDKCYLINLVNPSLNTSISAIIKGTRLYVEIINYNVNLEFDTGFDVSLNTCHKICFTYFKNGDTILFILHYDDYNYSSYYDELLLNEKLLISLGRRYYSGSEFYEFDGNLHMGVINNSYINVTTYNNIKANSIYYSNNNKFDKYNHLIIKEIKKNGNNILSNEYTYYKERISSEDINYGNTTKTRSYAYNNLNMVSSINDNFFGSHLYTYDSLNRVTSDNNTSYSYDLDGNITSAGGTNYSYDNLKRLTSIGYNSIYYPSSGNIYLPTQYKNHRFYYEGNKLRSVSIDDGDESDTVDYYYDEKGLMIRRHITRYFTEDDFEEEHDSKYFYDEYDRLITETSDSTRYDYLYNENGIYGYIINSTNRYYYIKDILGTIIGIVDENGVLKAKYDYDAYGNIISRTATVSNNILYKGYYYDYYSELYYLKSRFYKPEWCRFLTQDSFEYLEIYDLNGINLYSYCNNNPVMFIDENGHMPKWLKLAIGIGVIGGSLIVTLATGGATSGTLLASIHSVSSGVFLGSFISAGIGMTAGGLKLDENGIGWNWDNAATGFMIGSITGAISGGVNASLGVAGLSNGSYLTRGIMAGTDSLLGLGGYFAQNGINGTMDNISFLGAFISITGGLFNFSMPINKFFDAFWISTMSYEIAWVYDNLRSLFKKKEVDF